MNFMFGCVLYDSMIMYMIWINNKSSSVMNKINKRNKDSRDLCPLQESKAGHFQVLDLSSI